jgi:hypothetical protein
MFFTTFSAMFVVTVLAILESAALLLLKIDFALHEEQ